MTIALPTRIISEIRNYLKQVYEQDYQQALKAIEALVEKYGVTDNFEKTSFKNSEAFLMATADALSGGGHKPLENLLGFMRENGEGLFSTLHVLPFCEASYPNSTAVIDYKKVNAGLGGLGDFTKAHPFNLMTDIEINHVSNRSVWLKSYLDDEEGYDNLFITSIADFDYSNVYSDGREPHFSRFAKVHHGRPVHLISTQGDGVVDLNYADYRTFVRMLDVILYYATSNFAALRLVDAEYMWKDLSFEWEGHYKTHYLLKIIRLVMDLVKPDLALAVSTPQKRGTALNYLGSGRDEMQFVYNEALPALLLHAMLNGNSRRLSRWVLSLETGSTFTSLLNVTASYNEIDLRPLEGILPKASIESMARQALENGGTVVYAKKDADNEEMPQKLNIGYLDALKKKGDANETLLKRFMASQAIQAVLPGIPAVYIHALLGSRDYANTSAKGDVPAWIMSAHKPLDMLELAQELDNQYSLRSQVFKAYTEMLRIRNIQPAFNPRSGFEVAVLDPSVFVLRRYALKQTIWTFTNTSGGHRRVSLDSIGYFADFEDLLTGREFKSGQIELGPYEFLWLTPKRPNAIPKVESPAVEEEKLAQGD